MVYGIEKDVLTPVIKEIRHSLKEYIKNNNVLLTEGCLELICGTYEKYLNEIYVDNLNFNSIKMLYYASARLFKDAIYKRISIERGVLSEYDNKLLDETLDTRLYEIVEKSLSKDNVKM